MQEEFNALIDKAANDEKFLSEVVEPLSKQDEFVAKLWALYKKFREFKNLQIAQLGIHRNDYLMHKNEGLKMVEFNTISSSFGCLCSKLWSVHDLVLKNELGMERKPENSPKYIDSSVQIVEALFEAWKLYNNKSAYLLFVVVNEGERNICDQQYLEMQLIQKSVPVIRRSFAQMRNCLKLGTKGELFLEENREIALVYYRTAYAPSLYTSDTDWEVRLILEKSRSIKCPSIEYHLMTLKKIQQKLCVAGQLERFVMDRDVIKRLKKIFIGTYGLEASNAEGQKALKIALQNPENFVLKPQLEGGGNNIYGAKIVEVLNSLTNREKEAYILMEKIVSPTTKNIIVRGKNESFEPQDCLSEISVFGCFLRDNNGKVLFNKTSGHLVRTKNEGVDEGGVAAGFSAIDTIFLV